MQKEEHEKNKRKYEHILNRIAEAFLYKNLN